MKTNYMERSEIHVNEKEEAFSREEKGSQTWAYPIEFRLRIVRLFLEEGYRASLICEEFGISTHSVRRWVDAHCRDGVQGLKPKPRPGGETSVTPEVQQRGLG